MAGNPFDAIKGQVEGLVGNMVKPFQDMKQNFDNMIGPVIQMVGNLANQAEKFIFPFVNGFVRAVYNIVDTIFGTLGIVRNGGSIPLLLDLNPAKIFRSMAIGDFSVTTTTQRLNLIHSYSDWTPEKVKYKNTNFDEKHVSRLHKSKVSRKQR